MDQTAKQSTVDRIQQATNVLVTVSNDPSVDQLSACIGLTLFLNKLGKHATAVFSGKVPSTLEFLQPDKTIEKDTDSLRDFIISLDKAKADKLRYKVEDKVVKIFITPYRTSISDKDFEFSQGDFNVDVVIALGVHGKEELDRAIVAHGRILHDATVISINNETASTIGTINWQDPQASSLCEMLVEMADVIQPDNLDGQMATSFLTGIVAETKRFSNEKTTSRTMTLSAQLMASGANQQLVATQLQSGSGAISSKKSDSADVGDDGTLEIDHDSSKDDQADVPLPEPPVSGDQNSPIANVKSEDYSQDGSSLRTSSGGPTYSREPQRGGTLSANTRAEDLTSSTDPLIGSDNGGLVKRDDDWAMGRPVPPNDLGDKKLSTIEDAVIDQDKTLAEIETTVGSPHAGAVPGNPSTQIDDLAAAAKNLADEIPNQPTARVGSTPLDMNVQGQVPRTADYFVNTTVPPRPTATGPTLSLPADPGIPPEQTGATNANPSSPPPVPPPMMPPASS